MDWTVLIRSRVWDRVDVDTWYAQNTLIYVANTDLAKYSELPREANRSRVLVTLVHPRNYLQAVHMQEQAMQLADPRSMSPARFLLAFPAVCGGLLRRGLLRDPIRNPGWRQGPALDASTRRKNSRGIATGGPRPCAAPLDGRQIRRWRSGGVFGKSDPRSRRRSTSTDRISRARDIDPGQGRMRMEAC
jgi:hypothetical protein